VDDTQSSKVGYLLISFFVVMIAGAIVTKYLTPETCDINGKSRTLEELSFGKSHRKEMERVEREAQSHERRK